MRIERLSHQLGFNIHWTAFPLHPETPHQGRLLSDLFADHPGYMEAMWPRLKQAAAELNLQFGERDKTFNSRAACELACWATEEDQAWPFHLAIYEAYFVQGQNIALPEVLLEVVQKTGLPTDKATEILEKRTYADQIEGDWMRCAQLGVRAIPTMHHGRELLVGYQSEEAIVEFLQRVREKVKG